MSEKKRGILFWVCAFIGGAIVLFVGSAVIVGIFGSKDQPLSQDELAETATKIMTTCDMRILGRIQKEGEHLSGDQAENVTKCIDEMSAAYIAGVKAGRK